MYVFLYKSIIYIFYIIENKLRNITFFIINILFSIGLLIIRYFIRAYFKII
jgi:hypothetical protein